MITNQTKNQHLLWRAGFGLPPESITKLSEIASHELYSQVEKKSQKKPEYIDVADDTIKGLLMGVGDVAKMQQPLQPQTMQDEQTKQEKRKELQKESAEEIKSLNITWLNEMVNSEAQLREKMSLFWHGHFACRIVNVYYQQLLLDEIRTNALENFGDLLRGVSKTAAMLNFLNNQQNQKQHPNENFAREVMELFTMGRGNYTENDVKEGARAFTGWGFKLNGEFVFRPNIHDDGEKTFLNKRGNFDGDDVIDILLEQKATALFITKKIYRYFVNENVDDEKIKWLAARFYHSNYHITSLMNDIFTSNWFYDEKNIGAHIKSPIELLVGIRKILPMQLENEYIQLLFQHALGQILFYPPNVAGWPGDKYWIDSSTLMLRLRLPQLIKNDETFYLTPKPDDDQQMGMKENFNGKKNPGKINIPSLQGFQVLANIDWNSYIKQFESVPEKNLYDVLEGVILQTPPGSVNQNAVNKIANSKTREDYIKTVTIALMSTPEYQLS